MRKVAITGLGVVSPMGSSPELFFSNLMAGMPAVKRMSHEFAEHLTVKIAAEVDFDPSVHFSVKEARTLDRTTQMAFVAASQAWNDSGIVLSEADKKRVGVYMGTGLGGARTIDDVSHQLYKKGASRVNPLSVLKIMCNAAASEIAIKYGLTGPCLTFSVACASSAVAIGEALRLVKSGLADVVLAGGVEGLITFTSLKSWESLGVLAVEDAENPAASCRPFSKDRSGFVMGEGAAVLVVEEMGRARTRGARIYGELAGYGVTTDARHITLPDVEGQATAMRMALAEAGVAVGEIGYINAHGTATTANDLVETQAIKSVFGQRAYDVPVSSTKSMHGHLLGAGGAAEFIAALMAMNNKAIPPTANLRVPDPECDLDYVANSGRTGVEVHSVMSNSFAFGGSNAVLVARET